MTNLLKLGYIMYLYLLRNVGHAKKATTQSAVRHTLLSVDSNTHTHTSDFHLQLPLVYKGDPFYFQVVLQVLYLRDVGLHWGIYWINLHLFFSPELLGVNCLALISLIFRDL